MYFLILLKPSLDFLKEMHELIELLFAINNKPTRHITFYQGNNCYRKCHTEVTLGMDWDRDDPASRNYQELPSLLSWHFFLCLLHINLYALLTQVNYKKLWLLLQDFNNKNRKVKLWLKLFLVGFFLDCSVWYDVCSGRDTELRTSQFVD